MTVFEAYDDLKELGVECRLLVCGSEFTSSYLLIIDSQHGLDDAMRGVLGQIKDGAFSDVVVLHGTILK